MSTYSWKIDSVDSEMNTMEVTYVNEDKETVLNLPVPALGIEVSEWIDKFAPRTEWDGTIPTSAIAGAQGLGLVVLPVVAPEPPAPANENPNVVGSANEEYLRALIFQVLEEIKAAQV